MIHTALARKYRPNRFADLVGQEHVAVGLRGAVARDRVAHAYLLTGPRGVGKTSAARILAMALNCGDRQPSDGEPCAMCESCQSIWSGHANLDVVEIDAASNRGVDDARDLRERAMYAASSADRHKVYIVDEAHMLTREAWNALLKILEEPPPRVVFVFATTEPHKIFNTAAPVMSRLQRYDFKSLGPGAIFDRLAYVAEAEGLRADAAALELLARAANGGMRDALSALDQVVVFGDGTITVEGTRQALGLIPDEVYQELLEIVLGHRSGEVFPFVARLVESGADLPEFLKGAGEVLRSLLNGMLGGAPDVLRDTIAGVVQDGELVPGDVLRMIRLLAEAENAVRRSVNPRLHVEALLLQWALLDRTVALEDLLASVGSGVPAPSAKPQAASKHRPTSPATRPAGPKPAAGPNRSGPEVSEANEQQQPRESTAPAARRDPGTLTLAELQTLWPAVQDAVGASSRMLREALAHATPDAVVGDTVRLSVGDSEVHLDGLKNGIARIATAIEHVTGATVSVELRAAGSEQPAGAAAPPGRLDQKSDRAERLKGYRAKDPTLDAAVDALGLELLD